MGVLAYASLRRRRADARLLPTWTWLPILLADIALVAPWWNHGYNFIARVVFCGVIGLAIPLVREAPRSLLTRAAHTIAVYSYGIYLIHLLAMRVGFGVLRDSPVPVQLLVTFAVLTASCYAGYHLIERPGIALGQRLLGARRQPIPLEATAPAP